MATPNRYDGCPADTVSTVEPSISLRFERAPTRERRPREADRCRRTDEPLRAGGLVVRLSDGQPAVTDEDGTGRQSRFAAALVRYSIIACAAATSNATAACSGEGVLPWEPADVCSPSVSKDAGNPDPADVELRADAGASDVAPDCPETAAPDAVEAGPDVSLLDATEDVLGPYEDVTPTEADAFQPLHEAGSDASGDGNPPGYAVAMIQELAAVCTASGGYFQSGDCVCPTESVGGGQVRKNFSARGGGRCVRPGFIEDPCLARGGFERVFDEEGIDALRACVTAAFVYSFERASVRLEVPAAWPETDARALAQWLDARLTQPSSLYVRLSAPPDAVDVLVLLVGSTTIESHHAHSSFQLPSPDPGDTSLNPTASYRHFHVPSVAHLDSALGNLPPSSAPPRNTTPAPAAGPLGPMIERAIAETSFDLYRSAKVTPAHERCLGLCDLAQDYTVGGDAGVWATWRDRRYQGGVIWRDTLAIGSSDHQRIDGWVVFDLGGQPTLIYRIDYTASRLKPTVFAYDRNWLLLGSFAHDLLPDAAQASAVVGAAAPLGADDVGVVLCDSGMKFDDGRLNAALVVGPHPSDLLGGGSLLGHVQAPADDAVGYLDGVRWTSLGVFPEETLPNIHGADMASMLIEASAAIRVLSVSAGRCLKNAQALTPIANDAVTSAQVRVVNLSATDIIDSEACRERFPTGLDPHFVWVAAAGNTGRSYTQDNPLARCPQELAPRNNLIVVSAAENGATFWRMSDFGASYSDIAADCTGISGTCGGTSNAAPRVAATAALIVREHRAAISNPMVRMAILLSASVPTRVLPLRSGGYLSRSDALRAARELVSQGFGARDSLTSAEAGSVLSALYSDSAYVTTKLNALERNGTFSP